MIRNLFTPIHGGGVRPASVTPPLTPGSAQFDGASSLGLSPGLPIPNGQGFTFSFWWKRTGAAGTYPNILTQTSNPSNTTKNMFWVGFYNLGAVVRPVFYASDTSNSSPGGSDMAANSWNFFLVAYDDSVLNAPTVKQCRNGGTYGAPSGGMDLPVNNNTASCNLFLGNGFGDGFGQAPAGGSVGCMDSLFFWNRVLTGAEASSVYNAGAGMDFKDLSGSLLTGLAAAYNLDGPVNGKWPDSSGNGLHLSVTGNVVVGPPRGS